MSAEKFFDSMGAKPIKYTPKKPTKDQVAANGAALEGSKRLTTAQQVAWFGFAVFGDKEVSWVKDHFSVGGKSFTPDQVVLAASKGTALAE
jgi:hypothetical protein